MSKNTPNIEFGLKTIMYIWVLKRHFYIILWILQYQNNSLDLLYIASCWFWTSYSVLELSPSCTGGWYLSQLLLWGNVRILVPTSSRLAWKKKKKNYWLFLWNVMLKQRYKINKAKKDCREALTRCTHNSHLNKELFFGIKSRSGLTSCRLERTSPSTSLLLTIDFILED